MKFLVAFVLAFLVAFAQSQQAIKPIDSCLNNVGSGVSGIAQYYISANSQTRQRLVTDLQAATNQCNTALNGLGSGLEAKVDCDAILGQVKSAKPHELAKIHAKYLACLKN